MSTLMTMRAADAAIQIIRRAQVFFSAHSFIYGHFHPRRYQFTARVYRVIRADAFAIFRKETFTQRAAWKVRLDRRQFLALHAKLT